MYQPGLTLSTRPCISCNEKFITREGSERTICLKCVRMYPERVPEKERAAVFTMAKMEQT
jgi:hypothetical protein